MTVRDMRNRYSHGYGEGKPNGLPRSQSGATKSVSPLFENPAALQNLSPQANASVPAHSARGFGYRLQPGVARAYPMRKTHHEDFTTILRKDLKKQ